jgi:DNA-directed RNA polymerase subunit N (RpoN/RPB10)
MSTQKHDLQCLTCGHTISEGQELEYFAQYSAKVSPETPLDVLQEVGTLLDHMKPIASTLGHASSDARFFLDLNDISEFGWLLSHLVEDAERRLRWAIDAMDAWKAEHDAQQADARTEG